MINMEEVLVANITGLLVLIFTFLSRTGKRRKKALSYRLIDAMMTITGCALVAEIISFAIDGIPGVAFHHLQYLTNGYLFLASSSVGALWVLYVVERIYHDKKQNRQWIVPVAVPFAAVLILIVCDLFGAGLIFSINSQNVYVRGKINWLPYVFLFYYYVSSLIFALVAVRKQTMAHFFPIHYFVLPSLFGTLAQNFHYGLAIGWLFVSLALLFVQLYLFNRNAYIDDLSGLFNRRFYNRVAERLVKSRRVNTVGGIMIDIDRFKLINDNFGHSAGDEVIQVFGTLLADLLEKDVRFFRLAGDEFTVLALNADDEMMRRIMQSIREKVDERNRITQKPFRLAISMGYTVCNTSQFEVNAFLHEMDMKMYKEKASHYAGSNNE